MLLKITGDRDHLVKIKLSGKVSQYEWDYDSDPIENSLTTDIYGRQLIIDMSDVDHVDSSGVSWLLGVDKRFRAGDGRMALHSCQPNVTKIFSILKIDTRISIVPDEQASTELMNGE